MKRNKAALLLAGVLAFGSVAAPVYAEPAGEMVEAVSAVAEEVPAGTIEDDTDSLEKGEDTVSADNIGSADEAVSAEEFVDDAPALMALEAAAELPQDLTWTTNADGKIEIRYQEDAVYPDLRFAIWSKENGQDDLSWINAKSEDGKIFTAVFDAAKLKHFGTVFIHAYTGAATCVMKTTVEVEGPSIGTVTVEDMDEAAGTCTLVLSGIAHPELIRDVLVPTWSNPKQADIVWYNAVKVTGTNPEDLVYKVPMKISNHSYNTGTYNVHVYMRDTLGVQRFQVKTTVDFAIKGTPVVTATDQSTRYTADVKDLQVPGGWSELLYAVWSQENGQDDLKWISTRSTSAGININDFKHLGLYNVHLYAVQKNGAMKFVGKTTFTPEIDPPVVELGERSGDGKVSVLLKNFVMQSGLKEVSAAVWSKNNGQDDIRWYKGSRQSDGSYVIPVDLKNHKDFGQYCVHVYAKTTAGDMLFQGKTDDLMVEEPKQAEVIVSDVREAEGAFTVTVKLPEDSMAVTKIEVPVWCASDQSDIKWYSTVKKADGSYQVTVKTSNHKEHAGTYHIHVYGTFLNGQLSFLGKSSQVMNPAPVSISKASAGGKRTVIIRNCPNAKSVLVPVWSAANGQDDLVWYQASKNSSGAWQATIDPANHKNGGEYLVHVYADGAFSGNSTFNMEYSEVKTAFTELAASMEVAEENDQLILVQASGTTCQVAMLNKNPDGSWFQLLSTSGYVGINGVGPTTEWNRRTPPGVYGFTKAFGILPSPGTAFDYVKVDQSHYWVDDVNSRYYNKFVSTKTVAKDWASAEHLIDYAGSYNYCLAIDYNPECTPGVGSAIFLHCSAGRPTGGCVSVPESVMKKILQNVRKDCKIVIE